VKAVVFEAKYLFYSIKSPISYQVRVSNILPSASTLLGALYKGYVEANNFDYNDNTYRDFLNRIEFAGFTCIPPNEHGYIKIKEFSLPLKHWRFERDRVIGDQRKKGGKELEADVVLRQYIATNAKLIGIAVLDDKDVDTIVEALYHIDWLGNTESLVSIRLLQVANVVKLDCESKKEVVKNYYMMQIINRDVNLMPSRGIIEQCGTMPRDHWGNRTPSDICYVWHPLEPVMPNTYKLLKLGDVQEHILKHNCNVLAVKTLDSINLAFINQGFECIKSSLG